MLARIVAASARRPVPVLAAVAVLVLAGAALALRLEPSAATDTLVGSGTAEFRATEDYRKKFGDDAIIVLVEGELSRLVLTADLQRLLGLEGCISGNVPKGVTPLGGPDGPCARLGEAKPVKVVFGPGTFINESVRQISNEFAAQQRQAKRESRKVAKAARKLALARGLSAAEADRLAQEAARLRQAQFLTQALQLGLKYGLRQAPSLDDTTFVSRIVFSDRAVGEPKARFAYLFPDRDSALVQVRLKPGLTDEQRSDAIDMVREAVAMPEWQPQNGSRYVVTGVPVVVDGLTESISRSIMLLLLAVVLVMAATLAVVFRSRARMLPLLVALGAAALTFGGLSLAGASLTMASIAVLPVLVGLAVDYAIQFQSRAEETQDVRHAALLGGPTILTAGAATAAGFLVLALSPVPMVRGFGYLLVIGVALAFLVTVTAGVALLTLLRRRGPVRVPESVAASWRGAGELVTENPPARVVRRAAARVGRGALSLAERRPGRVLAAGFVVAAAGWALHGQTEVESDVQKLVPQDLRALRDLRTLQEATGVGGQIDVVVSSQELTTPAVVSWMADYQERLLERYGYRAGRGCGEAELCPAFSLPDLYSGDSAPESRSEIEALLDAVPAYFSQGVITPDRTTATLAFGIRLMPLERQAEVLDVMRDELDPPEGVRAELAGLTVLAAEAHADVASSWRRALQLIAGLLAVGLVLLVALRSARRALVPLVPIVLATGWSALLLFAVRVPLNPMSATLGALVIAIATEFSVLLSARYHSEREAGASVGESLRLTYSRTGSAVIASGLTAIAGFAVLALAAPLQYVFGGDAIRMLTEFGLVAVVDLLVALAGVMLVLPAVLVWAEGDFQDVRERLSALRRRAPQGAPG